MRVLLVEDDVQISAVLAELLAALGHDVCAIETTEESAVIAAAQDRPEMMIVDAHLTVGDGITAVARICRMSPIPHVLMSGVSLRTRHPGKVTLQKPFRAAELVSAMQAALKVAAAG